jgi:hypothetical protein
MLAANVQAQLVECDQVDQNGNVVETGGCIAKTLDQQIGTGQGDVDTPGSSVYLIKRDPARSIRRGRQLFQRKFTAAEGQGPRVDFTASGDITENRSLGAGLADSCAACHGRPRGAAGFGGDVNTFPDSRDSPHLFGLGLVEQLADEITSDLRAIRQQAIDQAMDDEDDDDSEDDGDDEFGDFVPVTKALTSKGINFGTITAFPDGSVETSEVTGVDPDLRVRPFLHHGATISIREFIVGALNAEMGLQVADPVLLAVTDPDNPVALASPAGFVFDPGLDTFERPRATSPTDDPDGDGVVNEIDPALLDHLEFYLLNYFKPGQYRVTESAEDGLEKMREIGCTSCHVQNLTIDNDRRVADVETVYDPDKGIINQLFATATPLFLVVDDGDPFPQLLPNGNSFVVENFFSDLKRHNLGPAFEERDFDGSRITEHVTEPLWGVGSSPPYGHDGRSINLDQVIRRHGGEAEPSKLAYVALSDDDQLKIQEFLGTLVLFPPDDTASSLNPGLPDATDVQDPANHGSINLGALFQIPSEGGE